MFLKLNAKGEIEFTTCCISDPDVLVNVRTGKFAYGLLPAFGKIRAVRSIIHYANEILIPIVVLDNDGVVVKFSSVNGQLKEVPFSIDLSIDTGIETIKEQGNITIDELFHQDKNNNTNCNSNELSQP